MDELKPARRPWLKRWQLAVITAAVAGALVVVFLLPSSPRQPTYQGRSVDGWLKEVFNFKAGNQAKALQALCAMGPEAVPFQIEALARRDSSRDKIYQRVFQSMPGVVQQWLPRPADARTMRSAASLALINNPGARKFTPELIRLLANKDADVRLHVSGVISDWTGPEHQEFLPILIGALQDPDARVRQHIAISLACMGRSAEAATPALKGLLTDPDPKVSQAAGLALKRIQPELADKSRTPDGPDR